MDDVALLTPRQARQRFRQGLKTPTAGWCKGYVQTNLLIVPKEFAYDALLFAQRNPRSCPVLEVTDEGDPRPLRFAPDADLRTDLPAYRVYENGVRVAETTSIVDLWRDDFVSFLVGCSFTFEAALLDAGIPLKHISLGLNVAMYRTNIRCRPAGRLQGPMVVSMRPIPAELVARAVEVSARFPHSHGAPIHIGEPEKIGIRDLAKPDFGDPVPIAPGELPVFWACGVTFEAAVAASRPPLAITHSPGHMFISDVKDSATTFF